MNNWNTIHSTARIGIQSQNKSSKDPRSEYQRDIDRIIFSPSFRRLQNKTQVFPLPGSALVHNRLTHSLEVSSVGRSLGTLIGDHICRTEELTEESQYFYRHELSNVVSAACLCHDIGNPSFGHSGEKAISNYFIENEPELKSSFKNAEWTDLITFEGNANAIRLLTQKHQGKADGGFRLTASTLAAIAKYPCESLAMNKSLNKVHRKKYGFFQTEKKIFQQIADQVGLIKENDSPLIYKRHPFVYLVEAADDICYTIMDLEDAQKLQIISYEECVERLIALINGITNGKRQSVERISEFISDKNEQVSFLRAMAINALINHSVQIFKENKDVIIEGNLDEGLLDILGNEHKEWNEIQQFSLQKIYLNNKVVEIEIAGFNVMYVLLEHFLPTALNTSKSIKHKMIKKLIPDQFKPQEGETTYERVMHIIDFVSGMTDLYATDLYRKITGIEIRSL
ncbi:MAG: dNTP triphosphohydrolase [Saprospiraceae bacterium]